MSSTPPLHRLGFFGGSFDPPHLGHIELAKRVVEVARLECLWFVPAARNPLKVNGPEATGELRLAMLRAALADEAQLKVLDWELDQPPPSYTRRTIAHLSERFPGAQLCWLIGADQLATLHQWHEIEQLVREVHFLLLARPGSDKALPTIPSLSAEWIEAPEIDLSSTIVRARLRDGLPIDKLVPVPVLNLIHQHPNLYRAR
jgi:nicotinate-nucleotide adenylyltransferase